MIKKRSLGLALILTSFVLICLNMSGTTGAIIGIMFLDYLNVIASMIFILGVTLSVGRSKLEKDLAQNILRSGAIITDPKKIKKIARRMGYNEGREVREGYQIFSHGKPLTVIPNHKISPGVSRNIIKTLSAGESNFRKYSGYSA